MLCRTALRSTQPIIDPCGTAVKPYAARLLTGQIQTGQ